MQLEPRRTEQILRDDAGDAASASARDRLIPSHRRRTADPVVTCRRPWPSGPEARSTPVLRWRPTLPLSVRQLAWIGPLLAPTGV